MDRYASSETDSWSRVCTALFGFRAIHGYWPCELVIGCAAAAQLEIQLGPENFRRLTRRTRLHRVPSDTILALAAGSTGFAIDPESANAAPLRPDMVADWLGLPASP
jgi:hypothetical protein